MFIKIYFSEPGSPGDKPIFLCDKKDKTIDEYLHHPDAVFIDEISNAAINSLLHEIVKPEFHAGILMHKDIEKLKKSFFKHFTVIKAGGGAVLNNKNELLMIFRRGKWDLPKGKLDDGESIEQCALREVREETGITDIELGEKVTVTYHIYREFGKAILKESHWYKMKCGSEREPVPQTEEDITEIKWVGLKNLEKYTSNTFQTIKDVIDHL